MKSANSDKITQEEEEKEAKLANSEKTTEREEEDIGFTTCFKIVLL